MLHATPRTPEEQRTKVTKEATYQAAVEKSASASMLHTTLARPAPTTETNKGM